MVKLASMKHKLKICSLSLIRWKDSFSDSDLFDFPEEDFVNWFLSCTTRKLTRILLFLESGGSFCLIMYSTLVLLSDP